jgi:hypothetical protein
MITENYTFKDLMLDVIGSWKTKSAILKQLKRDYDYELDERMFRKMVENFNKEYRAHLTDGWYIAHSNRGYKITKDHVGRTKKARGEDCNLYFEEIIEQIKSPSTN